MKKGARPCRVRFIDKELFAAYLKLHEGKSEEKELAEWLEKALNDLRENPLRGIKIPHRMWPKSYVSTYGIDNLRKYDLPNGWRLAYTLNGNVVEIIAIILEWFDHKSYERRFGYKAR